ncbi:hypothetical protein [Actinocatenispora rupis]|uniref:Uncharacterized protein n=1 Tax=Actinocatenispora rupis TaxID=519421 RepID=A0A8J3J181_9ACTN|nr:hypothetical protein [Actinocatenispora rupis]GID12353.1 hypothetical protein Aru02nite_32420 [Actinocatenispora rupis]
MWHDGYLGHVPDAPHAHRGLADFRLRVPLRVGRTTVAADGLRLTGFAVLHDDEIERMYCTGARGTGVADALPRHGKHMVAPWYEHVVAAR